MRILLWVLAVAAVAVTVGDAQTIIHRSCYPTTTYQAPTYVTPGYYPTVVVKEFVPVVVPVEVYRDHYYAVDSYYRDKLLVDAIVGRLSSQFSNPQEQPRPKTPAFTPPASQPEPPIKTDVPAALQALVTSRCVKCHGNSGAGGRIDLTDLATVPAGLRWQSYGLVSSTEMPKGGPPIEDKDLTLFYEWAKAGSKLSAKK
jgi:cytochrome c553